jgi:creatinine amidohydrolase/Fe(II)-dependent formamide hydrolase-like protein
MGVSRLGNETSLTMALRPELVDLAAIGRDPIPTGIGGKPPWNASEAAGKDIINANVDIMAKKLEALNVTLPKRVLNDTYSHAKNMIE